MIVNMGYLDRSRKARIVRHKGHTFKSTGSERGNSDINPHVFFTCMVCGYTAIAEQNGNFWRSWTGPATILSCGEIIAGEIHSE